MNEPRTDLPGDSSASSNAPAGGWVLTSEAFDKLLAFLDPEPLRAAKAYETTRRKLTRLFQWRGCSYPEELVDETINRVARKVDQGVRIRTEDPYRYFCGVARLVFHEVIRREKRQRTALEAERWLLTQEAAAADDYEQDRQLNCLRQGLRSLPADHRDLILRYYQGEKSEKISNRRELAEDLGIQLNALRIRAHRIRGRLESAVRECLQSSEH
jgi:DNA-directed RNA polymerase specialized sigma24 family protein